MKAEIIFVADKHNEASAIIALRKMLPLLQKDGYDTLFIEMPSDEENLDEIIKYESKFAAARKVFFKRFPDRRIPENPSPIQKETIVRMGEEKLKAWCALPISLEYSENKVALLQEVKKIGMKLVPIDAVDPANTAPRERNAYMLNRVLRNLKISSSKKIIIFAGMAHILPFWFRKGDPLISVILDKDVYLRGLFNELLKSKILNIRKIYFFYSQKDLSYQRIQLSRSECPLLNPNILREFEIKKQNFSEVEKLLTADLKDQKLIESIEKKSNKVHVTILKTDEVDRNRDMKLYLQDLGAIVKEEDTKFIVEIESSVLKKGVRKNLNLNRIWRENLTEEENIILKQIISEIFIELGNNKIGQKGYLLTFSKIYYTTVMGIFSTKISSYFQEAIQGELVSTSDIKIPTQSTNVPDRTLLSLFKGHGKANFLWVAEKSINEPGFERIKMDIHQLREKFNFYYCENIFIPGGLTREIGDDAYSTFLWEQINIRLQSPLNDTLYVCFIDKEVGYGVFTSASIKAGTFIGIYAGRIEEKLEEDEYGMGIKDLTGYRINARSVGGVTRFIQHMPFSLQPIIEAIGKANKQQLMDISFGNGDFFDKEEQDRLDDVSVLKKFKMRYIEKLKEYNEEDKVSGLKDESYATANVRFFPLFYQGKPIIFFQACRDIGAKEQLGISYGRAYWAIRDKSPRYFDHNGKLIPELKAKSKESVMVSPMAFDYSSNQLSGLFKFIGTLSRTYNNSEPLTSVESALRLLIKKKDSDAIIKKLLTLARKENVVLDLVYQDSDGLTILNLAKKYNKEQAIKQLIIDSEICTNSTIHQLTSVSSFP